MKSNTIWTAAEAAKVTSGSVSGDWYCSGLSIDSRTVGSGDLFIALAGDYGDGHDYVLDALDKGAVAAVVSKKIEGVALDKLLLVDDTLQAMQSLAQGARDRVSARVVAVTGSLGKTSVKSMLAGVLDSMGQVCSSIKSYNNHWGVPYSLASMHAGTDFGVFEIGMNHAGEITPLSKLVRPDVAIITTVAPVHTEFFEDGLDGIARAKAEIFDGVAEGGSVILNRDNAHFDMLNELAIQKGLSVFSFGEHQQADARILSCLEASNGSRVKADILGEEVSYQLQIPGKHMACNALCVLLTVKVLGEDVQKAANKIAEQEPVSGRGRKEYIDVGVADNPVTLIDESYNASPDAMKAAFKVLALVDPGRGGRRIAILGDMLELGKQSAKFHEDLALPLKASNIDLVYTCGVQMQNLHNKLPANQRAKHTNTSEEMAEIVPDVLIPGDVVMVKGSLGSKMGTIVETLRALPVKLKKNVNNK